MLAEKTENLEDGWEDVLQELSSAEEFLDFFNIKFDQDVVHVNRLHILQRFHNYLSQVNEAMPEGHLARWTVYQKLLERAYRDFVESDALSEKVFRVFHTQGDCNAFVSIDTLGKSVE